MNTISIEEAIIRDGEILFAPTGHSMEPFIQAGRDFVRVKKKDHLTQCKRMEAILFMRPDGNYVLHRILDVKPGGYWVAGDNCTWGEPVADCQVLGIVTQIIRNKHIIDVHRKTYVASIYVWYIFWMIRYNIKKKKKRVKVLVKTLRK